MLGARESREVNHKIAEAIQMPGWSQAVQLRVAEEYPAQFGHLAKAGSSLIVPVTLSDVGSMLTMATNIIRHGSGGDGSSASSAPQLDGSGKPSGLA